MLQVSGRRLPQWVTTAPLTFVSKRQRTCWLKREGGGGEKAGGKHVKRSYKKRARPARSRALGWNEAQTWKWGRSTKRSPVHTHTPLPAPGIDTGSRQRWTWTRVMPHNRIVNNAPLSPGNAASARSTACASCGEGVKRMPTKYICRRWSSLWGLGKQTSTRQDRRAGGDTVKISTSPKMATKASLSPETTRPAWPQTHSVKRLPIASGNMARKLRPTGSPQMPNSLAKRSEARFMGSTSHANISAKI
mmetsp:Transcript_84771/g.237369  ORF Transcript_84771/g.237369 Transcript_84771/m.237369 type:complete len:248 (-) Transcript_84771:1438-2181(-)